MLYSAARAELACRVAGLMLAGTVSSSAFVAIVLILRR